MRSIRLVVLEATAVVACSGFGQAALAHSDIGSDKGGDLRTLAEQSNLVFVGRVARVDYRLALRSQEGAELPHTFVTYEIGEVMRGQSPGKTVTLRFMGGTDGAGRFMEISGVPQFQPGEQDLLFVSGNGENNCPLVLCEWGRFRVLKGGVYNNHGFPVRAVVKGNNVIARGMPPKEFLAFRYPAPKFADLIGNAEVQQLMKQQAMPVEDMRKRYEAEAPKQIELVREIPVAAGGDRPGRANAGTTAIATTPEGLPEGPMAIEEFTATVKRVLARTTRRPDPVRSIDPNGAIRVSMAKERVPGRMAAPTAVAAPQTAADKAELDALRKQDFNPVLKRR